MAKQKPLNPLLQRMLAPQAPAAPGTTATTTIASLFQQAAQAHQAGRLAEAETHCRKILEREPRQADALYLLGAVYQQTGQLADAEALLRQALAQREDARFLFALAGLLHQARRHPEADAVFRRTLELAPSLADVHNNHANLLAEIGRLDEAESAYRRAIALRPDFAFAHNNLGNLLKALNRPLEAEAAWRRTLELAPGHLPARLNLALLCAAAGKAEEAEQHYRLAPHSPDAHNNLATLLYRQGRSMEAEAAVRQALALRPAFPEALNNLGNLLREAGRHTEAVAAFGQAIALATRYADAHNNLGTAHKEMGEYEAALASCRQALQLAPNSADAHLNHAYLLLATGDFANGWREHEWRWHAGGRPGPRAFAVPQWDGQASLTGKTLFLHGEQGFGDSLQFMRYASLAAARGATVLLGVAPQLKALAASCPGVAGVFTTGDALPAFDLHCPLMSLPLAFGTALDTIPATVPYLAPAASAVEAWRQRMAPHKGWKIGLVWAGNPRKDLPESHAVDRRRSMPLAMLAPLLAVPGTCFFSLQLGEASAQGKGEVTGQLIDFTGDLHDFHDSAALVANLDLVISVDTAVAHLAGALGKPVWLFNRYDSCWRWLRGRTDSPWYPTMRLFRQEHPGDWAGVVAMASAALEQDLRNRRPA